MTQDNTTDDLDIIRKSRRTQIVGQLTAGVYHDFNNVLTVILAQVGMMELKMAPAPGSREQRSLNSIRDAAERGAHLVRRLSEFRNRRAMGNFICDLNGTVQSVVQMMERLIGDHIELDVQLGDIQSAVQADPALLEQAIVELILNAVEAMPTGGPLKITTHGGEHAVVVIRDHGTGLQEDLKAHLAQRGFSTKDGKPGLGLFLVQEFIRESGGQWTVSCPDDGGTLVSLSLRFSHVQAVS